MISTRQPRIHRFVVQTNQDNPIITEEKISIDSKTVKEKGIAEITFEIAKVTITDHISFRFKLLDYVIKK